MNIHLQNDMLIDRIAERLQRGGRASAFVVLHHYSDGVIPYLYRKRPTLEQVCEDISEDYDPTTDRVEIILTQYEVGA